MDLHTIQTELLKLENVYTGEHYHQGTALKKFGIETFESGDPSLISSFAHECYVYFDRCLAQSIPNDMHVYDKMKFLLETYNSGMPIDIIEFYGAACMRVLNQYLQ